LIRLTAVEFRQKYDGEGMLQRFREDLILPHLRTLRNFCPLTLGLNHGPDSKPSSEPGAQQSGGC
jgi:hypothetical protein